MKKNEYTCKWRVEYINLAYDGGGSQSWTQYYWTWLGAQFSKFRNLYISSWGGEAKLSRVEES